jgi:hypothetical protein
MKNLPDDVPEGGFPPYVCPSPSLTKTAPYAMTGELVFDEDGLYHLRLYLWEMASVRLLYTDEIAVQDREECERFLPPTLEWLFSWVSRPEEPTAETPPVIVSAPPRTVEEHWLYLGLKVGSSLRFYYRPIASPFIDNDSHHYYNVIAGLQASVYFLPFLGLQVEGLFTNDYAPYRAYDSLDTVASGSLSWYNAPFSAYSLMFPLTLKATLRRSFMSASILAGAYYVMPMGKMRNQALGGTFDYSLNPPLGYTAGINLGMKAGPGDVFLDIRWAQDLGETLTASGDSVYHRSMVSIALGYELGLFRRKK